MTLTLPTQTCTSVGSTTVEASFSWGPETGTTLSLGSTSISVYQNASYLSWLESLCSAGIDIDLRMQEEHLDLPSRGLRALRFDEAGGTTHLWVSDSAPITFGTPYLEPGISRLSPRAHLLFTLRLWNVPRLDFGKARWDDADAMESLLSRFANPETLVIEAALTNSDEITAAKRGHDAEEAAYRMGERVTRADHTPYTRVARILRDGLLGSAGSLRIFPIMVPNSKHVPGVVVHARYTNDESALFRLLQEDGLTQVEVPEPEEGTNLHLGRHHSTTVWAKNPTMFPSSDGALTDWLSDYRHSVRGWHTTVKYATA